MTCEGVLFTHPVVCSRLLSAANDLTNKFVIMSSTSVHSTATMRGWMKKTTNATFGIDKGDQAALLKIHGADGAYLSVLLGSLIGVSSVHFFLICSVFTNSSDNCRTLQAMDNKCDLPVLICPSQCTSLQSRQF